MYFIMFQRGHPGAPGWMPQNGGGNHKAAGGQLDCEDEEQEEEKGKLHAGESFCSLLDYCSLLIAGFGKGCSSNTAVV